MHPEQLATVLGTIAETLLSVPLRRAHSAAEQVFADDALIALMRYHGSFSGTLAVTFDPALARAISDLMIGGSFRERRGQADVVDAIGEIANIAAGNLRGLLAADCQLSLPSVHTASSLPQDVSQLPLLACAGLWMLERPLLVELRGANVGEN